MPALPPVKRFLTRAGVRIYRIPCEVMPDLTGRVYLVLGVGVPTLVDTGSDRGESIRQVLAGLEVVRREFGEAVGPGEIRRILITHAHLDHFGGLAELARLTNAEVGVHPLDAPHVAAYPQRARLTNLLVDVFLRRAGVAPERRPGLIRALGRAPERFPSVPVGLPLNDGLEIDGLRVHHTPGHSPGHVCIQVDDVLLAGDHILARTVSQQWPETIFPSTGLGHYFDSLGKVRRLPGIHLTLSGHEPVITNLEQRIEEIRGSHQRRLERLLDLLRNAPEPLSIDEITRKMYSHPHGLFALLALTDVGSRIEHLDQYGRIEIANFDEIGSAADPIYRYRIAAGGCP